jgi:serine/threonine protein phosphatase PrpC
VRVAIGARTDVGRVRESNQDSYLISEPLFGVADGMGGHLAGDVASATAVETVERLADANAPQRSEDLAGYLKEANVAVWEKAQADNNLQGMGTTFTLLNLRGDKGHFAHVGDSRAYLLRDGELKQVTQDHTLVERMVREGRIQREEAAHHPQRNIITRALGIEQDLDVDRLTLDLETGDRLLLCSDGLFSMIEDPDITSLLGQDVDLQQIADQLVDAANSAGGEDNITVVVVEVRELGESQQVNATTIPAPPQEREDTERRTAEEPEGREERSRRRVPRAVVVGILILMLLAGGAYAVGNYALDNSWFVGADEEGTVIIYRGIPDEVLGMDLRREEESTDLRLDDLPEAFQDNLRNGIRVDSLGDARQTVADLEDRSRDFGTNRSDKRSN